LLTPVARGQAPLDPGLAVAEDLLVPSLHSKCPLLWLVWS
jgi:hypothetical protein